MLDTAKALKSDTERLSQEEGTGHVLAPEPTAKVEVTLEPGVNLGAAAELGAKIILRAAHGMHAPGLLMDPHLAGE